ncbi:MAG: choice-of-anchor J domain-containing protein [bacterium]
MNKCVYRLMAAYFLLLSQYLVAQEKLPSESFEAEMFPPSDWKKVTRFGGEGWMRAAVGSAVPGFGTGDTFDAPPGGGRFVAFTSWKTGDADGNPETGQATEQWLITPRITDVQDGDTLRFYLRYFSKFGDSLDVLISTNGDSIDAFNIVIDTLSFVGEGNNAWVKYAYELINFVEAGSDIFIAFREHVANSSEEGDALFLDLVEVTSLVTGVDEKSNLPVQFALLQNHPNPFNPSTTIVFSLPKDSEVTLEIFNLLGQVVTTLVDRQPYAKGQREVLFDARDFASGIYYYRLEAGNFVEVKKMILVR